MYKIIMVDDEPWALKGIRNIIDWKSYGFTDILTFGNPVKALEAICEKCPDVVCTDVRMPGLSGLDLIEHCQKAGVSPLFVVISAYAEFEYAKRAMDNGAFSYILKPLEECEVLELAQKLKNALHKQQIEEASKSVNTLIMQALTSGRAVQFNSHIKQAGVFSKPYKICITDSITKTDSIPWFQIYDELSMAILPENSDAGVNSLCGYSRTARNEDLIYQCTQEALIAYYTLRFYGVKKSSLFYRDQDNSKINEYDEILNDINEGEILRAYELLDLMREKAREQRLMIDSLTYFYNVVLQGILSWYPKKVVPETFRSFGNCFQMYGVMKTEEAMFNSLRNLISNYIDSYISSADSSDAPLLAVRYVDKHYTENISLKLLSEKFNVSLSHLCRKFKDITGAPFMEYITKKRIAYACELLRHTPLPVSKVGLQAGYTDYFHFNKVFKAVTSVSPSAYRKERNDNADL